MLVLSRPLMESVESEAFERVTEVTPTQILSSAAVTAAHHDIHRRSAQLLRDRLSASPTGGG
jgi:hypothetical protein